MNHTYVNNMSSIINKFNIFSDKQLVEFVNNIKLFYLTGHHLLFVTFDNSVLDYNVWNKQLKKFEAFCESQEIIKFDCCYGDVGHYMALTDNGCVYSWGWNGSGQLGDGSRNECYEPKLINSLRESFIADISCGLNNTLVLTQCGDVYAFGSNNYGQCGNGRRDGNDQLKPIKIDIPNSAKVIAISCGYWHSIALTHSAHVFGWGQNDYGQLGTGNSQCSPVRMNVPLIKQIMCGQSYTVMLSSDGDIYFCGQSMTHWSDCGLSHRNPTQLNSSTTKFIKIAATNHSKLCVALSCDNKCFIFGKYDDNKNKVLIRDLKRTNFVSIDETFAFYNQITYKSVTITVKNTTIFENSFKELSLISSGGFSSVFKCEHRLTQKLYAIKKISFEPKNEQTVLKELKFLSEFKSNFVVKCAHSWIEHNYYLSSHSSDGNPQNNKDLNQLFYSPLQTQLLHIQMELCSLTLRDVINIVINECVITPNNTLSIIGYYISSELMYELIECVQYLHQQNPAIIHRDLKPENILITFANNRFVKLTDFGLSTYHSFADQSHTKYMGTKNYRSFEANSTNKYTTKSDIYSLGIILHELFQIESSCKTKNYLPVIEAQMNYISELVIKFVSYFPDDRPNCDHVLREKHLWLLSDQQLQSDRQFRQILIKTSKTESIENYFVEFFIQNKYNYKNSSAQTSTQSLLPSNPQSSTTTTQSIPQLRSLIANININTDISHDFDDEYQYFNDSLMRSESGFGLRLVSGSEEGSGVVIGAIILGGVAQRNGVLKVGDQVIAINDKSVIGLTHHEVVQRFTQTRTSVVNIRVKRKTYSSLV